MKNLILIIMVALIFVSCAKIDDVVAPTKDLTFDLVSPIRTTRDYDSNAESVAIYFMPQYEDVTWVSDLFNKDSSADEIMSSIAKTVAYNGLQVDNIVKDQYKLTILISELEESVDSIIDEDEDSDYFDSDDCEEIIEYEDVASTLVVKCQALVSNNSKLSELREKFNVNVENIQMALDGKTKGTKNWIETESTQTQLQISEDINEEVSLTLAARFIPNQLWVYKTSEGDIFDLSQTTAFDGRLVKLNFSIKERTENGDYTGRIYKAKLNRAFLEGVGVRFLGKINMYDQYRPDVILRKGNMKIILLIEE